MKRQGVVCSLLLLLAIPSWTLSKADQAALLPPLEWRSIGPDRGGRSIAVAGHEDQERGDAAPTEAYRRVFDELSTELAVHTDRLEEVITRDLPALNRELASAGLPTIVVRGAPLISD